MSGEHGPGWDDESADLLAKLWADGLSAGQIAPRLGKSRNAILGKVHRLGLPPRKVTERAPRTRKSSNLPLRPTRVGYGARSTVSLRPRSAPALTIVPRIVRDLQPSLRLDIHDLRECSCRWPSGDPKEGLTYCGHRKAAGSSYCLAHTAAAHQPSRPRQPSYIRLEALA
jgi:GcrA cell cycle regulator